MDVPWDLRASQGCSCSFQGFSRVLGVEVAFHWATGAIGAPSGVSGAFLECSKESQRVSGSLQWPQVFSGAFQGFSKRFQGYPVRLQRIPSSPKGCSKACDFRFLEVSEAFQRDSSCVRSVLALL